MNYDMTLPLVQAVTGKSENVLAEYKKILQLAKEQSLAQKKKDLEEHPDWSEFINLEQEEDILIYNVGDSQFILTNSLPKKKGVVDDLFIFQKITQKVV